MAAEKDDLGDDGMKLAGGGVGAVDVDVDVALGNREKGLGDFWRRCLAVAVVRE